MVGLILAQAVVTGMVTFAALAGGTHSEIQEPRQVVVRTAEDWQALWKAHSAEPAPIIDFSRSMVIGVFLGSRPTAGFTVEITAIRVRNNTAVVEYTERGPAPGAITAQVLTSPFHLVTVTRDLGAIEFSRR